MEYILTLTFMTEGGKKSSLTITGVNSSINADDANTLMDAILDNDIFETKSGAFVSRTFKTWCYLFSTILSTISNAALVLLIINRIYVIFKSYFMPTHLFSCSFLFLPYPQ